MVGSSSFPLFPFVVHYHRQQDDDDSEDDDEEKEGVKKHLLLFPLISNLFVISDFEMD